MILLVSHKTVKLNLNLSLSFIVRSFYHGISSRISRPE